MNITIIYGSETGNAEGLARDAEAQLKDLGHNVSVLDMDDTSVDQLADSEVLLVVTSTWGDGEPPMNAEALHQALQSADTDFSSVSYAVFALGMDSFEQFCQTGKDFDSYLERLGARRLCPIGLSNDDFDTLFPEWMEGIILGPLPETSVSQKTCFV